MRPRHLSAAIVLVSLVLMLVAMANAAPDGVTVTAISNSTSSPTGGGLINTSGGSITTLQLNGTTQNVRWKAFVGNISGKLVLEDAAGDAIYDWSLTTISGEVYATRHSDTVNWSGIACATTNHTEEENINLSHTSPDDNITATFDGQDNKELFVGTIQIPANTCQTTNLYQNSTDPAATTDSFEEVVLHDKGDGTHNLTNFADFGRIVYAQTLEDNVPGYDNQTTYDFQLIVPERGDPAWSSSTAYYFYIELS